MAPPVGQRPAKVPSVLRCAYARVVSLESAVRDLCASSGLDPPELRRADDPPEYADALLRRTFVAFPSRAPPLPPDVTFDQLGDPDDVISRALSLLFRWQNQPNNVLCNGARRRGPNTNRRSSAGGCQLRDDATDPAAPRPPDVDVVHRSAAIDALRRPAWRTFASRVGDAVFLHLLTRASVFTPAGERGSPGAAPVAAGSHLQLCGAPVASAARGRAGAAARARAATTPDARAREKTARGGKMATKAARGGWGRGVDGEGRVGGVGRDRGGRGRGRGGGGGGGDGPRGGRSGLGRSAAASSEDPRDRTASAPASVEDANVSPVGKLLRRASVFVRGVMTANPFMRRARETTPTTTPTRGAYYAARSRRNRATGTSSEDSVALVAESSDAHVSGSGGPAPQEATMASPPRSKPIRPSSWRRRRDAKAREAAAKAAEKEATVTSNVADDGRATRDSASAAMWDEIGHAAAAEASGEEDGSETVAEQTPPPPPPPPSTSNRTPRARAPTTPGSRTPAARSTPGSPRTRRASDARRAPGKEPRPGSVVFDASAFMHKSSYPRLPGLPRRHALNASGTGPAAARRLYRLIFVPPKAKDESARASVAAAAAAGGGGGGGSGAGGAAFPTAPAAWTPPAKHHNSRRVRRIPRRDREALLPLLSAMLRRASKCPYGALLDLHCPTPPWLSRRGGPATDAPADAPRSLLASFTPPKAVAAFLWSAVSRIVPREMLGGPRSRAAIRAFLLRLVVLRRFEQCTLHEAMVGVREREFPWLCGKRGEWIDDDDAGSRARRGGPVAASEARRARLRRWMRWLVAELAVPLLRSHFYCTETESHRLRVFYYRKGVWARLTAAHLAAMTEDPAGETRASLAVGGDHLGEGDPAAATAAGAAYRRMPRRRARLLLQRHLLGFARLRLLPKATGLRPVAMLGRPAVASFRTLRGSNGGNAPGGGDGRWKARIGGRGQRDVLSFRPVNTSLRGVFDVLRHEAGAKPGVMGANVSDYRDVHRRLGPFIRRWRATQRRERRERRHDRDGEADVGEEDAAPRSRGGRCTATAAPAPSPPFIVAADVKGAFDSIPLRALERVVTELVTAGEYEVASVAHTRGGLSGGVRTKTRRVAARVGVAATTEPEPEREPDVGESSARGARRLKERRAGGVVVDLASPFRVHRSQILELLHEHLRRNVVRSGGVYLLQTVGIPQGSVLSTLLCAVFYAHLEAAHGLTRDERGGHEAAKDAVLCRWTDDLLHVSAEREPAEAFLSAALAGFAEYGCAVNPTKTSLNFDFAPAAADSGAASRSSATRAPPVIPRRETSVGRGANARACVAWCGLLIDSRTLEIRVDYGRYAGDWAREAVTVPGRAGSGRSNPFDRLDRRVVAYLRPKCTALLYDHSVNSPLVARLNVYQSFLLAAVKTHCFVAAANPRGKRGGGGGGGGGDGGGNKRGNSRGPSPTVLHDAIVAGVRYMEGAVRHHMAVARATLGASGRIQRAHIRYLGLHAFAKILRRKQARYRGTLALIAEDLRAPTMRAAARRLAPVVEESLSAVFDEIRF